MIVSRSIAVSIAIQATIVFATVLSAQGNPETRYESTATRAATTPTVKAAQTTVSPVIDGSDSDNIWKSAEPIHDFQLFAPSEGGIPRFKTSAKVAYDKRALYVFVRAFDPHPDSIATPMARRDVKTQSDHIVILIDPLRDRRTGYIFAVNPAGVKRDYITYDDSVEDIAWDSVWDVATQLDSLGWTAEFRIPFSQIRYANRGAHTFGFSVRRDIARIQERASWPQYRVSQPGISSQFGELTGVDGVDGGGRLELVPYLVAKNASAVSSNGRRRSQQTAGGLDLKYSPTANSTIDATINPDFGQVEADPASLNLTAFEQFLPERRPFFVEKINNLQFPIFCEAICHGLFYTRRIGRAPQLTPRFGTSTSPTTTTILGAARFTGRTNNGLSWGMLDAVTDREVGTATIEPRTNYLVARAQQDLRRGETGIGLMLTGVQRNLDTATAPYLHRTAYTGGIDFRHRFLDSRYQIAGYFSGSMVNGSSSAISLTQRNGLHLLQSPDNKGAFDSTRTQLQGTSQQISFAKVGGKLRYSSLYQRFSSGFEINDLGFTILGNQQFWTNHIERVFLKPNNVFRQSRVTLGSDQKFTSHGERTDLQFSVDGAMEFHDGSYASARVVLGRMGSTVCSSCTRGGPFVRNEPQQRATIQFYGNPRLRISPSVILSGSTSDGGRSSSISANSWVDMRISSRLFSSAGVTAGKSIDALQWTGNYGAIGSDSTHYTFATLQQPVVSLYAQIDYTVTPSMSFQFYGEPYIASGSYHNWKEVSDARSSSWDHRFTSFTGVDGAKLQDFNFNYKQFRSNLIYRWEFRPASILYFVWTQGRVQDGTDSGSLVVNRDIRNLFHERPDNTFLIKMTYWLNP